MNARKDAEYDVIRKGAKQATPPGQWRPVAYAAASPSRGVTMRPGALATAMTRTAAYLNHCAASPTYCDGEGWTTWLPGSNEARMLSGAANLLRWDDRDDMRKIVAAILPRIAKRQRTDGYNNYYPESESYQLSAGGNAERKNYDRVFWTRGLVDAGSYCDPSALRTLRRFYDWFNCQSVPRHYARGTQRHQRASRRRTGLFHARGQERRYRRDPAVFRRRLLARLPAQGRPVEHQPLPGATPAYLRAAGHRGIRRRVSGYRRQEVSRCGPGRWKIYRDNFEHVGGTAAICEGATYPPKSYFLTRQCAGETCGSVFWININSKLLQVYPDSEAYAAEIEKSIYNVLLACQDGRGYVRYHNFLHGKKDAATCSNTCCEVSSTAAFAKLPEYVYSISPDGIYVNLFAASSIAWQCGGGRAALTQHADFPFSPNVRLVVDAAPEGPLSIHVRVPSWATADMPVLVNSRLAGRGNPGSYLAIRRVWKPGDEIRFALPLGFSCEKYTGLEQSPDHRDRYALLYGPILMALVTPAAEGDGPLPRIAVDHARLPGLLKPREGRPLQYDVSEYPNYVYMPYWQVQNEVFSCFPVVDP